MNSGFSWKLAAMLLVLTNTLASARAQDQYRHSCMENGNYTSNSTYSANLNATLSSLSSNIGDYGFYNASVGRGQDRVNAIALCRGDVLLDQCRDCVKKAISALVELCPHKKQAIIWYELCMLRYSNETVYGVQTNDPAREWLNPRNANNPEKFMEERSALLDVLRGRAADGSSFLKVGAGSRSRNTSDSRIIYGLLQCTPDLSPGECGNCLIRAGQPLLSETGARRLLPSCNLRYELYRFYNETRLRELRAFVQQIPNSPPGTNGDNTGAGKDNDNTTKIVIIIVVPIVVCLLLAACAVVFLRKRKKQRPQEIAKTNDEISTVESLQYDFRTIRAATNDFADANKLGQGGFGAVYWGKLLDGQEIAVKRLSRESGQGDLEFKNEVLLVAKLQHRNLVRLLGFSLEGVERLLIYEFVPNASLNHFIFDPIKGSHLDWERRYKIIGGIAKGLLYLHEDSRLKIIHRDLKASNILLDGEMNPKIADFGMAKLFGQDETHGNTNKIAGTYGYMAPEYAMRGQFSVKSDVFSFGVLVLEILSGQKNFVKNEENAEDLLCIAWKNWREGTAENVIDPLLRAGRGSMRDMLRCIHIGLLCVQENAADRPTMASVLLMLNSSTITLPVAAQPAFVMSSRFGPGFSFIQEYDSKEWNSSKASRVKGVTSEASSQNEMSVTEFYPR